MAQRRSSRKADEEAIGKAEEKAIEKAKKKAAERRAKRKAIKKKAKEEEAIEKLNTGSIVKPGTKKRSVSIHEPSDRPQKTRKTKPSAPQHPQHPHPMWRRVLKTLSHHSTRHLPLSAQPLIAV